MQTLHCIADRMWLHTDRSHSKLGFNTCKKDKSIIRSDSVKDKIDQRYHTVELERFGNLSLDRQIKFRQFSVLHLLTNIMVTSLTSTDSYTVVPVIKQCTQLNSLGLYVSWQR